MRVLHILGVASVFLGMNVTARAENPCTIMDGRSALIGYEKGGPFELAHFKLTDGRLGIRSFLWEHWRSRVKGIAEARIGTVDAGNVRVLYIVHPDENGVWGIDVALKRPRGPSCASFRADSLVRLPIMKPDEDYPSQTMGFWPPDRLPAKLLADKDVRPPKLYQIQLVISGKPIGDVL